MILFVRLFTAYPTFRRLMTEESWKDWGPIYNSTLPPTAAKTGGHGSEEPVEYPSCHQLIQCVCLFISFHINPNQLFRRRFITITQETTWRRSEVRYIDVLRRGNRNGHWGKPDCLKGILMPSAKLIVILSWHKNQIRHNSIIRPRHGGGCSQHLARKIAFSFF